MDRPRRSRPFRYASAGVVVAGVILATIGVGVTTANTFPNNYDSRVADDAIHTYCLTSSYSTEEYKVVPEYAMYWLDATTQMSDQASASCLSHTDVWWYKTNLPVGTRGQRTCAVVGDIPSVCDRSNVHLDFAEIDIGGLDWEDRRKTACHELGHTVGFGEEPGSNYCMMQGGIPNANESYRRYSPHGIDHINAQY